MQVYFNSILFSIIRNDIVFYPASDPEKQPHLRQRCAKKTEAIRILHTKTDSTSLRSAVRSFIPEDQSCFSARLQVWMHYAEVQRLQAAEHLQRRAKSAPD